MIGIGIVGCNYGRSVLLPAFRSDPRCAVIALAGTNASRTAELARSANVPRGVGDWRLLLEDPAIAAIAIAVPPQSQPEIACRALDAGKPVFVEKPLAADLAGGEAMLAAARNSARPTIIDFNFPELSTWQEAKSLLGQGVLGQLRHMVVTWNVENDAVRLRLDSWKTRADGGGGLLGNFVSHCLHYLEWLCGPVAGLSARTFRFPDRAAQMSIAMAIGFSSGAAASLQVSCASFLGSGHRLEFYGEDGTLMLVNPTTDYFRGFRLLLARRGDAALRPVPVADDFPDPPTDARVGPVGRLVRRFIDACERGGTASPGFAEGYRVQCLIDAARRAQESGRWVDVALDAAEPPVSAPRGSPL